VQVTMARGLLAFYHGVSSLLENGNADGKPRERISLKLLIMHVKAPTVRKEGFGGGKKGGGTNGKPGGSGLWVIL